VVVDVRGEEAFGSAPEHDTTVAASNREVMRNRHVGRMPLLRREPPLKFRPPPANDLRRAGVSKPRELAPNRSSGNRLGRISLVGEPAVVVDEGMD
jgi:hypothetical protein